MPTATEVMRDKLIAGCDAVIDAGPIARRFIGADQVRLSKALRVFFQQADAATLDQIAALYDAEPVREEPPEVEGGVE